jgi:hypothetical protein
MNKRCKNVVKNFLILCSNLGDGESDNNDDESDTNYTPEYKAAKFRHFLNNLKTVNSIVKR